METEDRGGGRLHSHGPRPKQPIHQDGLPIPGSYSVGSSSLLGEPQSRGAAEPFSEYLTHHVSQDMYQFQEGFPSPMIELRSHSRGQKPQTLTVSL